MLWRLGVLILTTEFKWVMSGLTSSCVACARAMHVWELHARCSVVCSVVGRCKHCACIMCKLKCCHHAIHGVCTHCTICNIQWCDCSAIFRHLPENSKWTLRQVVINSGPLLHRFYPLNYTTPCQKTVRWCRLMGAKCHFVGLFQSWNNEVHCQTCTCHDLMICMIGWFCSAIQRNAYGLIYSGIYLQHLFAIMWPSWICHWNGRGPTRHSP